MFNMNFEESVKYVETQVRITKEKVDLNVMKELLKRLENPQDSFKSIHVAGTNGKGSVCAYMESALREQGYKTGLFTSPYIQVFNERIRISNINVSDDAFAQAATKVRKIAEDMHNNGYPAAAFFELLTAIAFEIFKCEKVDVAVIETGLGGTFDSTNVINPEISVITSIGYDHMNVLGNTIDEIAARKGGIIKRNTSVVISPQTYDEAYAVLLSIAKQKSSPLFATNKAGIRIDAIGFEGAKFNFNYSGIKADIETKLVGYHQVENAACAFLALCVLTQYADIKLSSDSILKGISSAKWPARLEVVDKDPLTIIDGAHNENAAKSLVKTISDFIPSGKVNIIFGVMQRKNYISMANELKKIAKCIYTVSINDEKSVDAVELKNELNEENINVQNIGDFAHTLEALKKDKDTPILICGSLYLAGIAKNTII